LKDDVVQGVNQTLHAVKAVARNPFGFTFHRSRLTLGRTSHNLQLRRRVPAKKNYNAIPRNAAANHRAHAHALVIRRVTNKWLVTCYEVDNQRWYPPNRVGIRGPRRERAPASKCNLVPAHSEHAIPVLSHPGVPLWRVSPRRP